MKKITQNPTLADTITFELSITEDSLYAVDKIVILHVNPKNREAVPVYVVGGTHPAWTEKNKTIDLRKAGPGQYEWDWHPSGQREGSYYITWNYRIHENKPLTFSAQFYIGTAPPLAVPHHWHQPDKYNTLLDRYLPSIYKQQVTEDDLTPEIIQKLHAAVAQGFADLEGLAEQLTDVTDANYTPQALLPILASFFDIQLRSPDPARWRRQIKQAFGLYKSKGTLKSLKEALDQAGIKLNKLTKLWQVVSPFIWVDSHIVPDDNTTVFELTRRPLQVTQVAIRSAKESQYVELPAEFVTVLPPQKAGEKFRVEWHGGKQDVGLYKGDVFRIQYCYKAMAAEDEELNKYVLSLPLADRRDEKEQQYPLKNWNVRLIEEDDPLFHRIITDRHPFHDPVVFGKVRTTFMYSEKVYNMDTYDGSLRDSTSPCDIDKDFLDSCVNCQGSKFSVDLEVTNLSNDRIQEAYEIIEEYSPFHAQLHAMNVRGSLHDFVLPPTDRIESKVSYKKEGRPGFVDQVGLKDHIGFTITWKDGKQEKGQL